MSVNIEKSEAWLQRLSHVGIGLRHHLGDQNTSYLGDIELVAKLPTKENLIEMSTKEIERVVEVLTDAKNVGDFH